MTSLFRDFYNFVFGLILAFVIVILLSVELFNPGLCRLDCAIGRNPIACIYMSLHNQGFLSTCNLPPEGV